MATDTIRVAVIIPVYNTPATFLQEALDSILTQTPTALNCELRIFLHNDGSNLPETVDTLKQYSEKYPSIVLSNGETNEGIVAALNALISLALEWNAKYIARMDADDIAMPDRFARQIAHLERHPEITVLGGAVKMFKSGTTLVKNVEYPTSPGMVHFGMFYNCILVHPSIVFRSALFLRSPKLLYQDEFIYAEDYALWLSLIAEGNVRLDNLPNPPILKLRKHAENESKLHHSKQKAASRRALKSVLDKIIALQEKDAPWTVSAETIDSILTGYETQTIITIQEAFKVTELLEQHLLGLDIFSASDKTSIRAESMKQLGALATMEMRLSSQHPSQLFCWSRWLSKKPNTQLSALLTEAQVSSLANSATSTLKSAEDINRVTVICFSKDRAFQLQEYLRTLDAFVIKASPSIKFDVHVIWKTSTSGFEASYRSLASQFPQFKWIQETNFVSHLTDAVKTAGPYILWGVDDVLFYNPTNLQKTLDLLRADASLLCATLRLSPNVTYCHPSNAHSILPSFTSVAAFKSTGGGVENFEQQLLSFDRSEATEDWNYPFELCATIMHKNIVTDVLSAIVKHNGVDGMSHPNKLEVTGSRLFSKTSEFAHARLGKCICIKNPVMSVITVNRVQDVCENRIYNEISLDELEQHFLQGKRLDLTYYRSKTFDAVHIGDFVLESST